MEKNKMGVSDYRSKLLQNPDFEKEAAKGEFIMDVTESIYEVLETENMDRKDLAATMNKTKGYISQLLNGDRNMTLATLAEILYALGRKPVLKVEKKEETEGIVIETDIKMKVPGWQKAKYNVKDINCNFNKAA